MPPMTRIRWVDRLHLGRPDGVCERQCVRDERERQTDVLRCALEALDYYGEDGAELLNERTAQWEQPTRKDRQEAMACNSG